MRAHQGGWVASMAEPSAPCVHELDSTALLAALRLGSSALPIGAFAYSQALEQAVVSRRVHDAASAERWIIGVLGASVLSLDVPLVRLLHAAWQASDTAEVARLSRLLFALRGSRELRDEERQLGRALGRLLAQLGVAAASSLAHDPRATLAAAFALAAAHFGIPAAAAAATYGFSWAEAQVGAATRLIPLGQSAAQRVLSQVLAEVARGLPRALALPEAELSSSTPGQTLLSIHHETEYTRLFRS